MSQMRRHVADYRQAVEDWFDDFEFEAEDTAEEVFEEMQDMWKPKNRFTLLDMLGNSVPDFMIWIQEQIDETQPDDTETITFPRETVEVDEELQSQIRDCKAELLQARKELSEFEDEDTRLERGGIVEGIKRFIRNIFRG